MNRIEKLVEFLKSDKRVNNTQIFFEETKTKPLIYEKIYSDDDITIIYYADYKFIDIIGLSEEEILDLEENLNLSEGDVLKQE